MNILQKTLFFMLVSMLIFVSASSNETEKNATTEEKTFLIPIDYNLSTGVFIAFWVFFGLCLLVLLFFCLMQAMDEGGTGRAHSKSRA